MVDTLMAVKNAGKTTGDMGVNPKNNGTPKSSILQGVSIIFTIHFGVSLFLEPPIYKNCVNNGNKRVLSTVAHQLVQLVMA